MRTHALNVRSRFVRELRVSLQIDGGEVPVSSRRLQGFAPKRERNEPAFFPSTNYNR